MGAVMNRKPLLLAAGLAGALLAVGTAAGPALAAQPARAPQAPGRSVTATLANNTSCTLVLTGGTVADGNLTQAVPSVIGPFSSGSWKITGLDAFGDDAADLAVVFAVTGCPTTGSEGYAMQNTDADGLWYTADACATQPIPGLVNTFSGVNAYHATLSIVQTADNPGTQVAKKPAVTPELGGCGGLPLS